MCPPASFFGSGVPVLKGALQRALMEKRAFDDAHDVWGVGGGEGGGRAASMLLSHVSNLKPATSPRRLFLAPAGGLTSPHLTGRQKEIFQNELLVFQTPLARSSRFGGQGFAPSTSQNHHAFFLGLGHEPSRSGEL